MAVLVTRPGQQGQSLCHQLQHLGVASEHQPLISLHPGRQLSDIAHALHRADLIIAVSQHAVHFTDQTLRQHQQHWPHSARYIAVGQKTAQILSTKTQQNVDYPQVGDSEHLLALAPLHEVTNRRIVILRGNGGRDLIFDTLQARGALVEYREVYRRENIALCSDLLVPLWQNKHIAQLVVTSSGQLEHLVSQIGKRYQAWLFGLTLYVPSERIAQDARQWGFVDVITTPSASNSDLLAALQPKQQDKT
ncbi:uroporphyrinogen-III synthase [Vibrio scophthalmi]|uniref:uroporphyrinogen-III synthase n=1 Tax=Vibrio scophthalmi TaxID=45658 RepID=UPI002FF05D31